MAWVASVAAPAPAVIGPAYAEKFDRAVRLLDEYRGDTAVLEAARVELDGVLADNPRYAPAYREKARYFIMRGYINSRRFKPGSLEAADSVLRKAIEIDPDYAEAFVLRGHLYRMMNRHQDAVRALEMAGKIGTDDPWLQSNWADLLIDEGNYEAAAQRYRKVLDSGTQNKKVLASAYDGLIEYYLGRGMLDEADKMHRQAIAFEPESAWNYGNYAHFLLCRKDDYEGSIARSRQALSIMNYGVGRYWLASALYRKWAASTMPGAELDMQSYLEAQSLYDDPYEVGAQSSTCPPLRFVAQALVRRDNSSVSLPFESH